MVLGTAVVSVPLNGLELPNPGDGDGDGDPGDGDGDPGDGDGDPGEGGSETGSTSETAGETVGGSEDGSGCSCSSHENQRGPGALALFGFVLCGLARRRQ
jgi:MYXO-CTERM domain-containing protein